MRLLDVNTFTFTEFHSKIPKYVITSHRWVAGAEVMLAGMQAGMQTHSYGYRKVKGFAEFIKTYLPGINWLWIDTCCIDQKSSTELSEAINSMFRWYRNAEVCLAYLHDVPVAADIASFEESVWFRRGWTLQELLAPAVVVFVSQDWEVIGHKGKGGPVHGGLPMSVGPVLNDQIAEITQIPELILEDYAASYALSVQEKLSWMEKRQTTREEDHSYALLGILDISMNIRYGDGLERTRERLYRKLHARVNNSKVDDYQSIQRGQSPGIGFITPPLHRPTVMPEISYIQDSSSNEMASIRRWLSPPPIDSVSAKRLPDRVLGSCKWITQTAAYREWLSNSPPHDVGKLFWIHGPAGLGKSMLNADMVHDLVIREKQVVASYFTSATNVGHPESVLRSWLEQCAELDPVARAIILALIPQERPGATVSSEELWAVLKSVVSAAGRRIFALDGLDRFARNFDFRKAFLERLLGVLTTGQARVLITSRDERDLRSAFYPGSVTGVKLTILEHMITPRDLQADVTAFTKSILLRKLPAMSSEERDGLVSHIVQRSDGMFAWLRLLESRISPGQPADQVRSTVDSTISELDEDYRQKLQAIGREDRDIRNSAGRVLAWVMYSSTQIDGRELRRALVSALSQEKSPFISLERVLDVFDGLLVEQLRNQTDDVKVATIDFVLPSLRHCLATRLHEHGHDESLSWILTERDAHLYLTRECLYQLNRARSTEWDNIASVAPQASLLRYAAEFWHVHASALPSQSVDFHDLLERFLSSNNPQFVAWSTFFESRVESYGDWQTRSASVPPPLYYAARFNLVQAMHSFKDEWVPSINRVGGMYGTALQAVCAEGHGQAFDLLMEWDVDVNVKSGRHETALYAAARDGKQDMVASLVGKDAYSSIPNYAGYTPLHAASIAGHAGVVECLAKRGANISTSDNDGYTPLHAASKNGRLDVVRMLIDMGAPVAVMSNDGWSPLTLASWGGHVEIAKVLIGKGASISSTDSDGRTPLSIASGNGQLEMVKFLIDRGANPSVQCNGGFTPLYSASSEGHLGVIEFLLSKGASISTRDNDGWTPLYRASLDGHLEVVKFLVEKGADISERCESGFTPLYAASYNGHLDIVKFLVDRGADVEAVNDNGASPLIGACALGHLEVVEFLFGRGATIATKTKTNTAALRDATRCGHSELVKYLVGKGADIEAADEDGWTPLHLASAYGHAEVVKLLADKGASLSTLNKKGSNPLWTAVWRGHLQVVAQLVEHGADVSAPDRQGFTPVAYASWAGHLDVVRYLASKGADISSATNKGWTPLHTAAQKGNLDLVKCLVENGARILAENGPGQTPLNSATVNNHPDVAEYFQSPEVKKLAAAESSHKGSTSWRNFKHKVKQIGKH